MVENRTEIYLYTLDFSAGSDWLNIEYRLTPCKDVDKVSIVQLIRLTAVWMHGRIVVEALGQKVYQHGYGETVQPQ